MFAYFRIPCLQAGIKFIGVMVDCKKSLNQIKKYFVSQTSTFVKPIISNKDQKNELHWLGKSDWKWFKLRFHFFFTLVKSEKLSSYAQKPWFWPILQIMPRNACFLALPPSFQISSRWIVLASSNLSHFQQLLFHTFAPPMHEVNCLVFVLFICFNEYFVFFSLNIFYIFLMLINWLS